MNDRAVIGGNNPPEPTPFELSKQAIEDLYEEARQWLDGDPVSTQAQADALNTLQARIKDAAKEAEKNRKAEAKPFDDGKAEVQARYKPIITKADAADETVKAALKPYLIALARKQEEEARKAREEAMRLQQEAMEAMRQRDAANLQSREEAERLVQEAKAADAAARKAENAKAHAKGEGRATALRTVHRAVMVDNKEAAAWVWVEHNGDLMEFVQSLADKAVRAGKRSIRGFNVIEEKVL
ncbi:hypothetical protein CN138_08970 [Sinorhizobium meliloti]|uniref:hypothetical protein n=1 Tax=Rhizobium meliloti TaxID=382 RepID=UPI000FD80D11|nr:hypothetical protein [Sinorhizobium meliloti]RVL72385.1 hypothetical protein CN138_08970 [Sinorhizobium meliloti]